MEESLNRDYEYMRLIDDLSYKKDGKLKVDWTLTQYNGRPTLAFLGSTDKIDWLLNFLCAFIPLWLYKKFLVSVGWAFAWKSIKKSVNEAVSGIENKEKLLIIGHSYGSAMAVFAGEELFHVYGIKAELITFGSVRPILIGVRYFKKCFSKITQYCHRGDMVCLCPPFFRRLNTVKIGKSRNIFNTGKWHNDYGNPEHYQL